MVEQPAVAIDKLGSIERDGKSYSLFQMVIVKITRTYPILENFNM